jgi:hypothetical protein
MNVDLDDLKPKPEDYFMVDNGNSVPQHVGQARYQHYSRKRLQTLAILKMRMDDIKSGETFKVSLNQRLNTAGAAAPRFEYM